MGRSKFGEEQMAMALRVIGRCIASSLAAMGFAAVASAYPKLVVTNIANNSLCYFDNVGNNAFITLPYGSPPCGGAAAPALHRARFSMGAAAVSGISVQQLYLSGAAASDVGVAGYNYLASVPDVTFQIYVDIPEGQAWTVDLTSIARGALATYDDSDPGPASATLEGAVQPFNVTIGPNGYGFGAPGWGTSITTGAGPSTTCIPFEGSRSDVNVVTGTGPASFSVQMVSVLRTYSGGNESAVLFGHDNVLPDYTTGSMIDDNPGTLTRKITHADNYLQLNPTASCNGRNLQDGYRLELALHYAPVPTGPAPTQIFTPLGSPLIASGISADGAVIVGWGSGEAMRWDTANGAYGLKDLSGGSFGSWANGASQDGSVIVGQGSSGSTPGGEAFRWDAIQGMIGLGDLLGASFYSQATGVSTDGTVVVGESESSEGMRAFRWDPANGMVDLGVYGEGWQSHAGAVSADGSVVVGWSGYSYYLHQAMRWDAASGMVGLGVLSGSAEYSEANAVSADGSVVVGGSYTASGHYEAFRWHAAHGMIGLGDLAGGGFESYATAVSADGGRIVGVGSSATSGEAAFVWTADRGMQSLDALLTSFGADLTGWELSHPTGISADGLTIVGYGRNPSGATEGWIAVLPAPPPVPLGPGVSAATLLLVGAVGVLRLWIAPRV